MTLRNISCGPLGFRHKPSHNNIISEYQPATSTGCYKTSPLGESLYSLLVSRTEVNNTHHSAAQFSNFFFLEGAGHYVWGLGVYFINFRFSIVFFGTTGESHMDNGCQIRQPQEPTPCIHSENIFSTSSSRVSSPTVPQLHFPIPNLQISLRYLNINYFPSSMSPAF